MGLAAGPWAAPWPTLLAAVGLGLWIWALPAWRGGWGPLVGWWWAAAYLKLSVGQHWHVLTYATTVQVPWPEQVLGYLGVTLLWSALSKGPILGAWALQRRWAWTWPVAFPLAWVLGEATVSWLFVLSQDDWWAPLWQEGWALRAVGTWGWNPALLGLLFAAAAGERAWRLRSALWAWGAAVPTLALVAAPVLPAADLRPLEGLGAIAMTDYAPRPWPIQGLKLILWPELMSSEAPYLSEGGAVQRRLRLATRAPGVQHLMGLRVRQAEGLALNAMVLTDPEGQVLGVRGKRLLFPFIETPVGGILLWNQAFRPGEAPPILRPPGLPPCAALLCLEAMDHAQSRQAKALGARWIALGAQDGMLVGHPWALHQVMGMNVWLAVCTGLPVVRSSFAGQACIVAPDGRILAASSLGQRTLLRVP